MDFKPFNAAQLGPLRAGLIQHPAEHDFAGRVLKTGQGIQTAHVGPFPFAAAPAGVHGRVIRIWRILQVNVTSDVVLGGICACRMTSKPWPCMSPHLWPAGTLGRWCVQQAVGQLLQLRAPLALHSIQFSTCMGQKNRRGGAAHGCQKTEALRVFDHLPRMHGQLGPLVGARPR